MDVTRATLTVVTALTVALAPASATATPLDPCDLSVERTGELIAQVGIPAPEGWRVVISCDVDSYWSGYADGEARTLTIWPRTTTDLDWITWTYVHEVAHAYDIEEVTPQERALWRELRGISLAPDWWSYGNGETPTPEEWAATPAEDLAESFATCWWGSYPWGDWRPAGTQPPTSDQCWTLVGVTGVSALVR